MNAELSRRAFLASAATSALSLAGCGAAQGGQAATTDSAEPVTVRVGSLKGPTSIGLVAFMDKAAQDDTGLANTYEFTISAAADEIVPKVISGDLDVALVPANVASVLYNKTEGGIVALDVNTLGVLNVVTGDASVTSFDDLAGRTVYLTGKGTTPEYVMGYLLEKAGFADTVTLEFKSEAAEVVSALAADTAAVGILPEPYKTAALAKNEALSSPVSLSDVWDGYATDGSRLVTGVTVVRSEFLQENPEAVEEFLEQQSQSVEDVNADPQTWAQSVVDHGIIEAAPVAQKAIPGCNLVCLTGAEMKSALSGYLGVLADYDASSVGGKLPGDDFYHNA